MAFAPAARGADRHVDPAFMVRGRPEIPVQLVPATQDQADRLQPGNVVRLIAEIGDIHREACHD